MKEGDERFSATENDTAPTTPGPIDYSIYRTPSGKNTFRGVKSVIIGPAFLIKPFPCRPVLLRAVQSVAKLGEHVRPARGEQETQKSVEPKVPV